jgi:hypothetical protein
MTVYVVLCNSAGELDRKEVKCNEGDDSAETGSAIYDAMLDWTLAVGDTIKVIEA